MSNSAEAWHNYRQCRNDYVHAIANAKSQHVKDQVSKLENQSLGGKTWWQSIKSFLGTCSSKSKSIPALILPNGTAVHDSQGKAEVLNNFFSSHSTIDDTEAKLPDYNEGNNDNPLSTISLEEDDTRDILKSLNTSKASGPDGVSPMLLRHTADTFCKPLTRLFNLSLQRGVFPQTWKQANVTPLFKTGNASLPNNYRPVSLLSVLGKVLEKAVFKSLFNYLRDANAIYSYQSGFLPGVSTTHHLVHLYHIMSEAFDKQKKIRMVFGDISKAFDKVWHKGLIFTLKKMGVKGYV